LGTQDLAVQAVALKVADYATVEVDLMEVTAAVVQTIELAVI
jgi:hypothetical protein